MSQSPILSIIVPCYNAEDTLDETLTSIVSQNFKAWEAIIVNDGSTDNTEEIVLKWLGKDSRFRYFKNENQGLGKTRNFAINKSIGRYILPLDSDNKVSETFISKAVEILEKKKDVGVVHGHANYFGDKTGLWEVKEFDYQKILLSNYIDACAIFRKALWDEVGGYDERMPYQGNEDWDFWLALGKLKTVFVHLNEVTFDYRVTKKSMINSFTQEMFDANRAYIRKKYYQEYYINFRKNKELIDFYNQKPLKAIVFFGKKWLKQLYASK